MTMQKKIISFCLTIVKGDGTPRCSYLNDAGLPIWMWTILFMDQSCQAHNVGGEQSISIAEVACQLEQQFRSGLELKTLGTPDPSKPVERYVPLIARAQIESGLRQNRELQDSLLRTIELNRVWINE